VSELRKDPITGHWVIIAESRLARPNEYVAPAHPSLPGGCPFCEGQESRTPPEVAAVRNKGTPADGPGWSIRVIPNRFPTLAPAASAAATPQSASLLEARPGYGYHEVIIVSPRHEPGLAFLPVDHARAVVRMFRDRVAALAKKPQISAVLLFENFGPESGGTLMHPHAQVVATPVVPPVLEEKVDGMRRFSRKHPDTCLLETVAKEERSQKTRIVLDDGIFLTSTPFASAHPYEVLILPERHSTSIIEATDAELDRLAELLPAVLRSLFTVAPSFSYNFMVHCAPNPMKSHPEFHWHIEIAPRLIRPDGFELGTGIAVNPVSPEAAASALRTALSQPAPSNPR
jgi:UDPglucose--hexose-1-phosphate uridylyltransferase